MAEGIGGTGYLYASTNWPYRSHVSDLAGAAPDFTLVGRAGKDQNTSTTAADHGRSPALRPGDPCAVPALSKTPLFLPRAWSNQFGVTSTNQAADAAVGAAVSAL